RRRKNKQLKCSGDNYLEKRRYWHAMASYSSSKPEEYEVTMKKVLSWAWFAYGISNGEIALDSTFDEYFVPLKSREGRKEFAESFYPSSEENDGSDFMLKGQEIAWIFNNLCADAFDSETCTVIHDSRTIRLSALGAVLHLIQDSFSQSHANRESCTQIKKGENVASSVMNCSPITQFYDYSDQS
ncbi:hypothetical protein, partial [Oleiphilus sp. HI0132]|uniref:hypothetical protein n=1 Tax=Oleiphilus sp. HI0132 TaxID=1822270 RepID=UPI000A610083